MPDSLPESALHECPRLVQMTEFVQSSAAYNLKDEAVNENYFSTYHAAKDAAATAGPNNENDPTTMNRMNIQNDAVVSGLKSGGSDGPRTRSSTGLKSTVPGGLGSEGSGGSAACSGTAKSSSATAMQMLSSARQSSVRSQSTAPLVSSAAVYKVSASSSSSSSTSTANAPAPTYERTKQTAVTTDTNSCKPMTRRAQKFDIYVDSKPSVPNAQSSSSSQHAGRKRDAADAGQGDDITDRRSALRGKAMMEESLPASLVAPQLSAASGRLNSGAVERKPHYELDLDKINAEMEQVQISDHRTRPMSRPAVISTPPASAGSSTREAWARTDDRPVVLAVEPEMQVKNHLSTPAPHHAENTAPAAESEAMFISTPQDQIISAKESKPLGTLETMHEMLNNSFSVMDGPAVKAASRNRWSKSNITSSASSSPVANVWVVRYVDYTSKYGLGFLFNTGSAGVYFNDSTKIVLSADGTVFQYTERRRRDSSTGSEHSSQKHLITCYPPELQKKVTLLKHFRNYLVDQQKNSTKTDGSDDDGSQGLTGNPGLIKEGVISDGACASVKFGTSSTRYNGLEENNWQRSNSEGAPDSPSAIDDEDDQDMPFLKKWVRTKHAILFRISNRTVQVVFYDRR